MLVHGLHLLAPRLHRGAIVVMLVFTRLPELHRALVVMLVHGHLELVPFFRLNATFVMLVHGHHPLEPVVHYDVKNVTLVLGLPS